LQDQTGAGRLHVGQTDRQTGVCREGIERQVETVKGQSVDQSSCDTSGRQTVDEEKENEREEAVDQSVKLQAGRPWMKRDS